MPEADITVHGGSMGAAASVMAAGEGLPENVSAVISDCAFTDVADIMEYQLRDKLCDSAALLEFGAEIMARIRTGSGWGAASVEQMAACSSVPILFIHGGADDFVPAEMVYELYDAAVCEKEIMVIPDAVHAQSVYKDTEKYWAAVFEFILNNKNG